MESKLLTKAIILLFIFSNINIIFISSSIADENQPQWPENWILFDSDPTENGASDDYRDVSNAYYYVNDYYLYFRLECYGYPNFTAEPETRYKWFIDTDNPHNMGQSGGKVFEAEYLLFVEDSPKPGGDGIGDIYLLPDLDNDGLIQDDWPDYKNTPGPILNSSVTSYRIDNNSIDLYIRQENISFPTYAYFTWATDQEDPNIDSAPDIDRSNNYWDADLTKADLSITKSDSKDPLIIEESFVYNISVNNHGPHTAENVNISDTIPSGITFISSDPSPNGSDGSTYWWTFSSLDIGDSVDISINVTVDPEFTGIITNTAEVSSDVYDPIPGNNEDSEETEICDIFYLSTDIDGNGTIITNPEKEYYLSGETVELTAIPYPGWSFSHWNGSINSTENPVSILMDSDKSLTANFTEDQYSLNITVNGKGVVIIDPDQENYTYGTIVTLNANPASGWKFDHWEGDLTGSDDPATINMTEDKNITANFKKKTTSSGDSGEWYSEPIEPVSEPNIPPIANAGGLYYGTVGEDILFNGSLSYDPDQYIESWVWDFGDGTYGWGKTTFHNYSSTGEYIVDLTVFDTEGANGTNTTIAIIIKPNLPPTLQEIIGPTEGFVDIDYNFSFVFEDEDNDQIKYTIYWNDGNKSESDFIAAGQFFNVSHKWTDPGIYNIIVIGDDNETISTEEFEIVIHDPGDKDIPEQNNILLILILLIAFFLTLLFYLLSEKNNKEEDEQNKK